MSYPDAPNNDDLEAAIDPREKPMGFFEHLDELRGTLTKCVIVYALCAIVLAIYSRDVKFLLEKPLDEIRPAYPTLDLKLRGNEVMSLMSMSMQLTFFGALGPALPFCLFFLGQFVAPALTPKEIRLVAPVCFSGLILFCMGAAFSYFILLPGALRFAAELHLFYNVSPEWTVNSYFKLVTWLVIGVACAFQFPLVVVILVWLGVLQVSTLRKYRRHAIVVILVIGAIVTPTTDPVTMCLFAVPVYLLYELAIVVGAVIVKRRPLGQRAV